MKNFRKLNFWQKSHSLILLLYKITENFPKEENFGISSQFRRAGSFISTNIAEGRGRGSDRDFKRIIQIAMGSAIETEYLVILSKDLNYVSNEEFAYLLIQIEEIKKMLSSLILKLKS